ncbi:MAG: methyltransferase domain-containing protein [Bacteroidales bacterium]
MANKFTYRSNEKELLDSTDVPSDLLYKNLKELAILNQKTGGHAISLKGVKQLITDRHKTYHLVDLGCGGGDSLKAIANWSRSNGFRIKLTGVDMNANAIEYMKIQCKDYPEITGIVSDYQDFLINNTSIDIVHCSLFCHHLTDEKLLELFAYFNQHVHTGFIISDLQRNWLTYYGAWLFTRLLNGTELAKNDGPVSALRGFKFKELDALLKKAYFKDYSIQKIWLFRYLIVGKTTNHESIIN